MVHHNLLEVFNLRGGVKTLGEVIVGGESHRSGLACRRSDTWKLASCLVEASWGFPNIQSAILGDPRHKEHNFRGYIQAQLGQAGGMVALSESKPLPPPPPTITSATAAPAVPITSTTTAPAATTTPTSVQRTANCAGIRYNYC